MGQDIHMWMEYRRSDGLWRILRGLKCDRCGGAGSIWYDQDRGNGQVGQEEETCWRCSGKGVNHLREDKEDERSYLTGAEVYSGRNYELFGALADSGRLDDRQRPLIEERGIPEDATPEFKRMVEEWDGGGHTYSWLDFDDVAAILVYEVEQSEPSPHMRWFIDSTVALMSKVARVRGPKNVRLVFFFDN